MTTPASSDFSPQPDFPQNPEFYRRVLDESPSPVLVVDENGNIVYGNRAIAELGGWTFEDSVGTSVLGYIHPEDAEALANAFFELAGSREARTFDGTPWASIECRLVATNGHAVPVTVTGSGGLTDPAVEGIIYDIRPAHEQDILRRGLTSLAEGEPIDTILSLIADMIALPPLDLDAAMLEPRGDGSYRVIGATSSEFESILQNAQDPMPWNSPTRVPRRTFVSQFPGGIGEDLFAAGFRDFWDVSPEAAIDLNSYRIVAAGPTIQHPANGPIDRLSRANELASVVLLRARADAMLEHSATHDRLTQLPNREGFYRSGAEALEASTSATAAVLFIDLDGFKEVNDEHGHAAGDRVLETVAARLVSVTRSVDLIGRLGGDEFVILVGASADRPANAARVNVIADRTLQQLRRDIDVGDESVRISASIGAVIVDTPTSLEELLARADAAMYEAKHAGGDRHLIVEPEG